MLIGLRFLLLIAVMGASIAFLGYLFTKNPRFLWATKMIIKVTLAFAVFIALIYMVERILLR